MHQQPSIVGVGPAASSYNIHSHHHHHHQRIKSVESYTFESSSPVSIDQPPYSSDDEYNNWSPLEYSLVAPQAHPASDDIASDTDLPDIFKNPPQLQPQLSVTTELNNVMEVINNDITNVEDPLFRSSTNVQGTFRVSQMPISINNTSSSNVPSSQQGTCSWSSWQQSPSNYHTGPSEGTSEISCSDNFVTTSHNITTAPQQQHYSYNVQVHPTNTQASYELMNALNEPQHPPHDNFHPAAIRQQCSHASAAGYNPYESVQSSPGHSGMTYHSMTPNSALPQCSYTAPENSYMKPPLSPAFRSDSAYPYPRTRTSQSSFTRRPKSETASSTSSSSSCLPSNHFDFSMNNHPMRPSSNPAMSHLQIDDVSSELDRIEARRLRNNQACRDSRLRRKKRRVEIENKAKNLTHQNNQLKCTVDNLEKEIAAFKTEIMRRLNVNSYQSALERLKHIRAKPY